MMPAGAPNEEICMNAADWAVKAFGLGVQAAAAPGAQRFELLTPGGPKPQQLSAATFVA
jgi:hypothetical protein